MKFLKISLSYLGIFFFFISTASAEIAETTIQSSLLTGPAEPMDHLGQIVLSLVMILVIIFFAAWLLKRFSAFPGGASGHLRVLGALSVGQREKIVLIQAGKEQIVVGVTTSRITLLSKLEQPIKVEEMRPMVSGAFATRLQEALSRNSKEK